jgi:hypothetical protein
MKRINAGRITRADQAWAPAHRENIENDRAARVDVVHGNLRKLVDADHEEVLPKDERIPAWAEQGVIIPRSELVEVLPILGKHVGLNKWTACAEPALIIDHVPGQPTVTLRSLIEFAAFKVTPVDGKFPEYQRVLEAAGASLVRNEADPMNTTALNRDYFRGAADIAAKLNAKAIHSFLGDGHAAAVFTFDGAPDTLLIIMPMRAAGDMVPDGVVKLLGSAGVSASVSALKAHVTRTVKALSLVKDDKQRDQLEARKSGFEQRIAHLLAITTEGPKQLEDKREAA